MQRSVRENIALPFSARPAQLGCDPMRREKARVDEAVERLQIDTRARARCGGCRAATSRR
jgi:ribose transport system ATP-binding protein